MVVAFQDFTKNLSISTTLGAKEHYEKVKKSHLFSKINQSLKITGIEIHAGNTIF